jgi:hypothetical protein
MFGKSKSYSIRESEIIHCKNYKQMYFSKAIPPYIFTMNLDDPHIYCKFIGRKLEIMNCPKENIKDRIGKIIHIKIDPIFNINTKILNIFNRKKILSELNFYDSEVLRFIRMLLPQVIAYQIFNITEVDFRNIAERKNKDDSTKANKILDLMDSIKEAIDYLNDENNFKFSIKTTKTKVFILDAIYNQDFFIRQYENYYLKRIFVNKKFFEYYSSRSIINYIGH